ncbi:MAG TPA: hypothetical protein VMS54_05040 [Vicinamibacterales bacterium]|nr:hypothetical protein [Vicinamibacterales bacterium]
MKRMKRAKEDHSAFVTVEGGLKEHRRTLETRTLQALQVSLRPTQKECAFFFSSLYAPHAFM